MRMLSKSVKRLISLSSLIISQNRQRKAITLQPDWLCVCHNRNLTEGGARGRPAAKDYERRPAVVNKPFTMHRAMSEDEESGSGSGSGSWSGSGSGYEDSDFENMLNFSDDSHSQNSHDIAVADFNQNEFATATSVVFPEGGAVNNNSNTSFK